MQILLPFFNTFQKTKKMKHKRLIKKEKNLFFNVREMILYTHTNIKSVFIIFYQQKYAKSD